MIANEINKRPFISFGLGKIEKTISLGDDVKVWQNEIYNKDTFDLYFDTLPQLDLYSFSFTPDSTGTFNLQASIKNKITDVEVLSNTIILNVV